MRVKKLHKNDKFCDNIFIIRDYGRRLISSMYVNANKYINKLRSKLITGELFLQDERVWPAHKKKKIKRFH